MARFNEEDYEEEDNLINNTINDEAEEAKQNVKETAQNAQNAVENAKRVGNVLERFGINAKSAVQNVTKKIGAKILPALGTIIAIALILFVAVGLIAFILNAPGFMREKFNEVVSEISQSAKEALYGTNHELSGEVISKEERVKLLNYLSKDLGFDVIGLGFVPTATYKTGENPETGERYEGKQEIADYNSRLGYFSGEDEIKEDESSNPDADLMYYYLMANERAYTINAEGLLTDGTISHAVITARFPLAHIFGKSNSWKGMIKIDQSAFDKVKDYISKEKIKVSVDRDSKRLKVENTTYEGMFSQIPILRNLHKTIDNFSFSLDGWTGRYGMPIEYSLALHISTLSSGLVKEMITNPNLQTEVELGLQSFKCDLNYKFNVDCNGTVKELDYFAKAENGGKTGIYNKILNGEEISESELSMEAIAYAKKKFANKYSFLIDGLRFDAGVHVETLEAMLGDRDLAVNINAANEMPDNYITSEGITMNGVPIFAMSTESNDYGLYSGAFVCEYNSDNSTPDETSGKLAYIHRGNTESTLDSEYSEYQLTNSTDMYDEYTFVIYQNGSEGNMDEYTGSSFIIPKGGNATEYDNSGIIHISSLQNMSADDLADVAYMDANNKVYQAYDAMFREIDWFLASANHTKNLDLYYNGSYDDFVDNIAQDPENAGGYMLYYTEMFREIVDENHRNYRSEPMRNRIIREMSYDLNEILNNLDQSSEGKQRFEELMKNTGLDANQIQRIVNKFEASGATEIREVVFTQPYIKRVIKHWFKDVIFEEENGEFSVYEKNNKTFELEYHPEEGDPGIEGVDIKVLLTPQKEDEGQYEQKEEPYVIKGDTVLKDGKVVTDEENPIEDYEGKGYQYGDGYRTTKKIFTKGYYYTFDGTAETSKSIFWQQQLENAKEGTYIVTVIDGRIYNVKGAGIISDETATQTVTEAQTGGNVSFYEDLPESVDSDGNIIRKAAKNYTLQITNSNLRYKSPAYYSQDEVEKQVEYINKTWEGMGVTSLRQHVSFDNVTSTGEVLANTGLSILKNCNTKDADYIYRDLKEMLIDLGYYTEAEFDQLDVKLKWFIPRYNPKQWPQNSAEDLTFAAVLNPREEEDEGENTNSGNNTSDQENNHDTFSMKNSTEKGFRKDLKIIAPGACTVTEVDEDTIEIEFDGLAQPSISALNGYKMTITGITPVAKVGAKLDEGDELARTGTTQIKVYLKNDIGRLLSNVSDYMSPKRAGNQPYEFTDDEIILLAYVINHEAAPEGLQGQMQYEIDRGYIISYDDSWSAAMAFAEAVGYVLTNRTLQNYGGYGTTIEQQTTAPGQYDGSFTIEYALAHESAISAGSMEAALVVAESDCDIILKPDDPSVTMSRDVTGESAWQFGHQIFWWLDMVRDGEMADYPTNPGAPGYPTAANWPWDGFLTYSY